MRDNPYKFFGLLWAIAILIGAVCFMSGCTVSIGAEGRTYYPGDSGEWSDPRKGFFDKGGMDGMYTTPAPKGFKTLGGE